jgi:hypothetical protein
MCFQALFFGVLYEKIMASIFYGRGMVHLFDVTYRDFGFLFSV